LFYFDASTAQKQHQRRSRASFEVKVALKERKYVNQRQNKAKAEHQKR